jgi:hypothetical protein
MCHSPYDVHAFASPQQARRRCGRFPLGARRLERPGDVLDVVGISGDERDHPFRLERRMIAVRIGPDLRMAVVAVGGKPKVDAVVVH